MCIDLFSTLIGYHLIYCHCRHCVEFTNAPHPLHHTHKRKYCQMTGKFKNISYFSKLRDFIQKHHVRISWPIQQHQSKINIKDIDSTCQYAGKRLCVTQLRNIPSEHPYSCRTIITAFHLIHFLNINNIFAGMIVVPCYHWIRSGVLVVFLVEPWKWKTMAV